MEAVREMVGQVAAEAGLAAGSAKKLIYLQGLSKDGRSLAEAAAAMRLTEDTVKSWCRRADICLADFDPFPREEFPVRPKPKIVLKVTSVKDDAPLFGARAQRPGGRCRHPIQSTVDGRVWCCDCGREIKLKKGRKS